MSKQNKEIYFNSPQRLTQLIGANTTVIVAGRRTGKTDSIAAPFVLRNMQRMPGSTGGIVVPTFKHGLTNTLPGLFAAWKRWGYIQGVHYVVGRKPPKSFARAIIEPSDYEHVISFYNGSVAVIISQDRPGSSNSLTLSWLLIDEAKFIDYERLKDETLPANGGIKSYFGKHSFNHSIMILSDMPQTQKGSWFLHYKEKMDEELIDTIKATIYEIWKTKERVRRLKDEGKAVPKYLKSYLLTLDTNLNKMRSVAVYYKEYSSIENLQLLGENYIKQMKRDLTPKNQNKTVVYYYDTTALGANYAVNEQDFHWVVCHEFEKRGWQVEDVYLSNPMRHDEKYLLINQGFAGKQRLMPFFNRQNNDDLILAIQTAGVVRGRNGFRKDKDF